MQFKAELRSILGVVALITLLLGAVSVSGTASAEDRSAIWCFDDGQWLPYSEGVPGSATRAQFNDCLYAAGKRGEVVMILGQIVAEGVLFDVGDSSLLWETLGWTDSDMFFLAYDSHVVIGYYCAPWFELRNGVLSQIQSELPCSHPPRLRPDNREVNQADFTIFTTGRQFVLDGADGWYHVNLDRTGFDGDPTPRGTVKLRNPIGSAGQGVWVTGKEEWLGATLHYVREPLTGTGGYPQVNRTRDWQSAISRSLTPRDFERAFYYLFPDWDAYWAEVRGSIDAILLDLFHMTADPAQPARDSIGRDGILIGDTVIFPSAGISSMFYLLSYVLVGDDNASMSGVVATLLMLWERYVPGFDRAEAVRLAESYSVEIGEPVGVQPVSDRTDHVIELLAKRPAGELHSDDTPIASHELLESIVLYVGVQYPAHLRAKVASTASFPELGCVTTEENFDGSQYQLHYGPQAEFPITESYRWNGLRAIGGSGGGEWAVNLHGTPIVPGRARLAISTPCPSGDWEKLRHVGYVEVVVVDPEESKP